MTFSRTSVGVVSGKVREGTNTEVICCEVLENTSIGAINCEVREDTSIGALDKIGSRTICVNDETDGGTITKAVGDLRSATKGETGSDAGSASRKVTGIVLESDVDSASNIGRDSAKG